MGATCDCRGAGSQLTRMMTAVMSSCWAAPPPSRDSDAAVHNPLERARSQPAPISELSSGMVAARGSRCGDGLILWPVGQRPRPDFQIAIISRTSPATAPDFATSGIGVPRAAHARSTVADSTSTSSVRVDIPNDSAALFTPIRVNPRLTSRLLWPAPCVSDTEGETTRV